MKVPFCVCWSHCYPSVSHYPDPISSATFTNLASSNARLSSRPPLLGQFCSYPVALFIFGAPVFSSLCAGGHAVWPGRQVTWCVCLCCPLLCRRVSYCFCVLCRHNAGARALQFITITGNERVPIARLDIHGPHTSKPCVFVHNPLYLIGVHKNTMSPGSPGVWGDRYLD